MKLLQIKDLAKMTGFHESTLRRWCEAGAGPRYMKIGPGGHYRFREEDVDRWLKRVQPQQESDSGTG